VNIVLEITSHRHLIEMFGGVFEAFVCSHIGYLCMGDLNDIDCDVGSFIDGFIGKITTVWTIIVSSLWKKSANKDPTRIVGVLADDVIERIKGCGISKAIIQRAFEVLGELEGANIMGAGGLVRERVIVIDRGIRDQ